MTVEFTGITLYRSLKLRPNHNNMRRLVDFTYFDPVTGTPPEYIDGKFDVIAARARRILSHRTATQVQAAAELTSWLLGQDWIAAEALEALANEFDALERGESPIRFGDDSEAQLLRRCTQRVSLDELDNLPGITWEELFAALALLAIADAAEWVAHYRNNRNIPEGDWIYLKTCGPYAVEAMEALCWAEHFAEVDNLKQEVAQAMETAHRKKLSLRSQRANIARHQKTNAVLRDLLHYYREGNYKSIAKAVSEFLKRYPPEKVKHLAPTNRERTLREGLSAAIKGKRELPE